jgi:hypothetical protein
MKAAFLFHTGARCPDKEGEMPDEVQTTTPTQPTPSGTFEEWLAGQDEGVKGLYTQHTAGLKNALDGERKANQDAQKQLRDLAKKAEKGSELEAELTKQADHLRALETQAAFQDKAHAMGVRNLKLAFIAAQQAGLVSDKGDCDFAKLKAEYPELFLSPPSGNAGTGTGQTNPKGPSMDQIIMGALGR